MKECYIEQKLTRAIRASGGLCLKFTSPGASDVPDRLCLMPEGRAFFCECKAKGKRPRALQIRQMERLEALGFRCFVVSDDDELREAVAYALRTS